MGKHRWGERNKDKRGNEHPKPDAKQNENKETIPRKTDKTMSGLLLWTCGCVFAVALSISVGYWFKENQGVAVWWGLAAWCTFGFAAVFAYGYYVIEPKTKLISPSDAEI